MRWKGKFALGLAAALSSAATGQAQVLTNGTSPLPQVSVVQQDARPIPTARSLAVAGQIVVAQETTQPQTNGATAPGPEASSEDAPASTSGPLGPTPLTKVNILQNLIFGKDNDKPLFHVAGWLDFDYTFRSTGQGINNVAPVMNRFGDEALARQLGIYLYRPLDPEKLSFGFNAIFIGGSDASFLGPTAGGWANTNPRFGSQFTDLNVTAHLPILTEGGVDVKAGRQTTCLGPMGALPWQRYFDSSDYAWYNLEEGRYTGVSTVWHITKRLDWYNGAEIGGWGVFFDNAVHGVDYLTQISYWLDEDAKNTKVWTTVLTGPTSFVTGQGGLNTTVLELGIQHNWNEYWYQIVDTQMCWSKAPIFQQVPAGYHENAYDVYTYIGRHMSSTCDINARLEWYYDQNGGFYPGGFGVPNTSYYNVTVGPDWHPTKFLQIRPEVRFDWANHGAFGPNNDQQKQLSLAIEALIKF
jgi:hypothetical protein